MDLETLNSKMDVLNEIILQMQTLISLIKSQMHDYQADEADEQLDIFY